eukprot:SM000277S10334  [mRNA]  locus=s277:111736:116023:+ [translate_table: standard]
MAAAVALPAECMLALRLRGRDAAAASGSRRSRAPLSWHTPPSRRLPRLQRAEPVGVRLCHGSGHASGAGGSDLPVTAAAAEAAAAAAEAARPAASALDIVLPAEEFRRAALVSSRDQYEAMYRQSVEDSDSFWADIANGFHWHKQFPITVGGLVHSENLDVRKGPIHIESCAPGTARYAPACQWFKGGTTNICYNAVDRHVAEGRGDKPAILWEGNEPQHSSQLTFGELKARVCQLANFLRERGVARGDSVAIYMPMLPELPVAMLACARIGAVHSVVFGGFSAEALAQRILDSRPSVVLTASGVMRGTKLIKLKAIVDQALALCDSQAFRPETCLVLENATALAKDQTPFTPGRDVWWQEEVKVQSEDSPVEWVDAEHPLFLLYTSGSTGKPKGVVHTTGGYMVYTATTFKHSFDYREGDVYWCTADCGWITGHSYLTYGPLLNGASVVVFEGVPNYPDAGRCWEVVDKYKVSIFYTAPTAIRALQRDGDQYVMRHSRQSLRVLGTVGEPINPSAWRWYYDVVGGGRCPISDTWWQTETGGHMITPLPGAWPLKPGSATLPFFGVQPTILDDSGKQLEGEASGYLCIKASWPGAFRTLYKDHERYEAAYFSTFPSFYFSGDGCRRDADGYFWLTGRVDDVINVSGHRIGTAEVESALVSHHLCTESAVVPFDHEIKGQGIHAFVILQEGAQFSEDIRRELISAVRNQIGAFAAPDRVQLAPGLPKTRSGKIMRRILRKIAAGESAELLGDTTTLADPSVVNQLLDSRP